MVITTISSLVSVGFLVALYMFAWRGHAIDRYREELFRLRDDLFEHAMRSKHTTFGSPIYKDLEILINNNIQFAHRISFLGVLVFVLLNNLRYPGIVVRTRVSADLERRLNELKPSDTSAYLNEIKARFDGLTIRYLMKISPAFVAYVGVIGLWYAAKRTFANIRLKNELKQHLVGGINWEVEYQAETYSLAV